MFRRLAGATVFIREIYSKRIESVALRCTRNNNKFPHTLVRAAVAHGLVGIVVPSTILLIAIANSQQNEIETIGPHALRCTDHGVNYG